MTFGDEVVTSDTYPVVDSEKDVVLDSVELLIVFTDVLIVVFREWAVLIADVFTEDGIELVEGSLSVVICGPLDEKRR